MRFAEQMGEIAEEQRRPFYGVLAHNLTVAVRGIRSDERISDAEKIDRAKWVNEILHSVTAKVYVLRLKTHERTEDDFERLLLESVAAHPGIAGEVGWAVKPTYRTITGVGM